MKCVDDVTRFGKESGQGQQLVHSLLCQEYPDMVALVEGNG